MLEACERVFENITGTQMYVTGAVGASAYHESFTVPYDLPDSRGYGETCASVAMAFFARQMLKNRADGQYADLLELELYNAVLAGMQLDGCRFFYVNPLQLDLRLAGRVPGYEHVLPRRPGWYRCACCPPNLARLIASLGAYLWAEDADTVYCHLLIGSEAVTSHGRIRMDSGYPWEGRAEVTVTDGGTFTLAVHIPAHAQTCVFTVNGERVVPEEKNGYGYLWRVWQPGDRLGITFDMPVRRIYADPRVRDCAGRVALARGPLVYCLEDADHAVPVLSIVLPGQAEVQPCREIPGLPSEWVGLRTEGLAEEPDGPLYGTQPPVRTPCRVTAIPYFAWANRQAGNMTVWIRETDTGHT